MFNDIDFSKMNELLQNAKEKIQNFENDAAKREFTAKSGGGLVSVSINGNFEIIDITIADELFEDKQSLQILLISAVNDAIKLAYEDKKNAAAAMFNLGGF